MLKIKNKIEFETNCFIGEVDSSMFNNSEEDRIKAVTDMASITRGKLGLDYDLDRRKKLYDRLLTESAGNPSVPFEFIPIYNEITQNYIRKIEIELSAIRLDLFIDNYKEEYIKFLSSKIEYLESILNYSWRTMNLRTYTNTFTFNKTEEIKDFKIIVGKVPWKVITHLRTHRAFSFLVESSRNKRYLNDVEFWYPSWWTSGMQAIMTEHDLLNRGSLLEKVSDKLLKPEEATMELSDRRLVYFSMSAWLEPNSWDNLFKVRGNGTGTQSITGIVVENIKKIISNK